ncbi:MAG: TetR/AcrR family transcriptional regulator [Deltaproteobacteria bacterium]|nr:MAG: TetR/AcrR family transcriptional regulator [Deltaproteobacteria bacterium]
MDRKPNRRTEIRQENTRILVLAALRAFATHGYENTTIRDIVEESGLSRGTFYNYLGDKPTALRAVTEWVVEQLREEVRQARHQASSVTELIQDAFVTMIDVMVRDPHVVNFIRMNGQAVRSISGDLELVHAATSDLAMDLERAIHAGLLSRQHAEWLAAAMVGATIEVLTRLEPDDDPKEAALYLAHIFLNGIRQA